MIKIFSLRPSTYKFFCGHVFKIIIYCYNNHCQILWEYWWYKIAVTLLPLKIEKIKISGSKRHLYALLLTGQLPNVKTTKVMKYCPWIQWYKSKLPYHFSHLVSIFIYSAWSALIYIESLQCFLVADCLVKIHCCCPDFFSSG